MTFKEDDLFITEEVIQHIQKCNRTRDAKLLEDGQLPVAEPIAAPEEIPLDLLNRLHGLGQAFCEPFLKFIYVAYTQFDPEILQSWGIDERHLRVIYGSADRRSIDAFEFSGYILINPVVTPTSEAVRCMLEGCGSIEDGNLYMWVVRPHEVEITAHIWRPGMEKPQLAACKVRGNGAGFLEHEADHLDGFTAASETIRHRLVDFRFIPDTVALGLTVPQLIDEEKDFAAYAGKTNTDWLVWNPDCERLEVINYKGDYIRNY